MKPRTTRLQRAWNIWLTLPEAVRMALIIIGFVALAFLSGCAHTNPVIQPRTAIPVQCMEPIPARPAMPTEALPIDATVDAYVQAAEAEIGRREGYEVELLTALQACTAPVTP